MKSWIKKSLLTVFGAGIAVGGLTACSGVRPWHHDSGPEHTARMQGRVVERVASRLELNAEQKLKFQALTDVVLAQRKAIAGTGADPRARLQAILAGNQLDRSGAQSLVDEKIRTLQTGSPAVIAALGDFYDSLQPAQQQKMREMVQNRRGWMGPQG